MTITSPKGFRASGVAAGLKTNGNADVALVVNDGPDTTAAGVFTGNRVKAAPVMWSQQVLRGGIVRAGDLMRLCRRPDTPLPTGSG